MEIKNKRILGLDLGTTSIGWADVIEGVTPEESSIVKIGVRVNPVTTDELLDFEKGKPVSINADRTLKRGMRRNLDRYQLRRQNLLDVLKKNGLMTEGQKLSEDGKNTTFETWQIRAKAVTEKIEKSELCRVLLAINKKRGYKSSRKAKTEEEGFLIDGMSIAKQLYEEDITPGQYVYKSLKTGKKLIPDFYRSDLQSEFDKVWAFQKQFHSEYLTDDFYLLLKGKGQRASAAIFWTQYGFNVAEIKDIDENLKNEKTIKLNLRDKKKHQGYYWRSIALSTRLDKEQVAYVLTEINSNLNSSSGYLGAISDRSKELYFNQLTVGQHLYKQLRENPHQKLKNQVFYRQDYLDEFETIWTEQQKHHKELTEELKSEIRDVVIFYQRKLRSQKDLINICEFENKEIEIIKDGNRIKRTIGMKVAPKSSLLFQEFKIWQVLNNLEVRKIGSNKQAYANERLIKNTEKALGLDLTSKEHIFLELNTKGNLSSTKLLRMMGLDVKEWELNYMEVEGNRTNKALYEAYLKILDLEGYDIKELLKLKTNKDEIELEDIDITAFEIKEMIRGVFESLNINTEILDFDAELNGSAFEQQASFQLWHLLYSYEGDDSLSGNERLYRLLSDKFGFKKEHAVILANIPLLDDYGSLSSKAMRKIYPYIKENKYSEACSYAGYNHSSMSMTKYEIENRPLKDKMELLKKNSLRNPVVEKILNQMVNLVNTLIDTNSKKDLNGQIIEVFKFDEIRIELGRELKKNSTERAEMTSNINSAKNENEKTLKILQSEFGIQNPSRYDIIRYRLYEELKNNGYKDLYSDTYISKDILFGKMIDVDHIIPQSRLFDDSFSNKTIVFKKDNLKKGNKTAIEFIESENSDDGVELFLQRIQHLYDLGRKKDGSGISKAKFQKLQKRSSEIGDGFIERDLRNTQYIAKKAKNMLLDITRSVVSTTGSITNKLREDWGLVNIMQEINFEKYWKLGLTEVFEKKDGTSKERIVDWSKRNDQRHHAMDALTVAFTKPNYIQYLNHLSARFDENNKVHRIIKAIEEKETVSVKDNNGNSKRLFRQPISEFRPIAKEHLMNILVSYKAKNKVVTKNKNKIKLAKGEKIKMELTPRGQLHKETIYGQYQFYQQKEEKIGVNFNLETIKKVANPIYREALKKRLEENKNDPKLAFTGKNSINKTAIFLNVEKTKFVPEKVKLIWLEKDYSIRKELNPENFKDVKIIDKVLDHKIKQILTNRLREFGGDPKRAFSDLDRNPIWLNQSKGIAIKRIKISGIKNAEPLQFKKNHLGEYIFNENSEKIPVDFISTGNNHHVAVYRDEVGNLQELVISFYEAVARVNQGLPIIDKSYNSHLGWKFQFSMKQNEMFVFPNEQTGFNPAEIDLMDVQNAGIISPNLFRVQKFSRVTYGNSIIREYVFRHHLETNTEEKKELKDIAFKNIKSMGYLENIRKVRINHIGQIVKVGEY